MTDQPSVDEILAMIPASAFKPATPLGEFAPKLTFEDRCAILAFHKKGIHSRVLAAAFKVNRRTIYLIVNARRGYKDVHDLRERMGWNDFIEKYATVNYVPRIAEAIETDAEKRTIAEQTRIDKRDMGPDSRKKRREGYHTFSVDIGAPERDTYEVKIWFEDNRWWIANAHCLSDPLRRHCQNHEKVPFISSDDAYAWAKDQVGEMQLYFDGKM